VFELQRMGMEILRRTTGPGILIKAGNIRNPNTSRIIVDPSFAKQIEEGINKSIIFAVSFLLLLNDNSLAVDPSILWGTWEKKEAI
jgi:hypothetical protein